MQIFQCTSIALVSQGHKDFHHNENSLIYSKAILDWNVNRKVKLRNIENLWYKTPKILNTKFITDYEDVYFK